MRWSNTSRGKNIIILFGQVQNICKFLPDWCNGNTGDSKSFDGGSIPSSGAKFPQLARLASGHFFTKKKVDLFV